MNENLLEYKNIHVKIKYDQISKNVQIHHKEFPLLKILIISWKDNYNKYKQEFSKNSENQYLA